MDGPSPGPDYLSALVRGHGNYRSIRSVADLDCRVTRVRVRLSSAIESPDAVFFQWWLFTNTGPRLTALRYPLAELIENRGDAGERDSLPRRSAPPAKPADRYHRACTIPHRKNACS